MVNVRTPLADFQWGALLRKESIEQTTHYLRWLLIAISGIIILLVTISVYDQFLEVTVSIDTVRNNVRSRQVAIQEQQIKKKKRGDYSYISKKSIFGRIGAPPAPPKEVEPDAPKVSDVPLNLIGTFVTDGSDPYAIIEDKKKKTQEVFVLNDSVFDTATLVGIHPNKVEIKRLGKIEILRIDDTPDSSESEPGGDTSSAASESFSVDEEELDQALENLPLLLTQARAVPYFKNGKSVGLRLFAIKRGSLYEKIGLRNGDVIKAVNGNSLGDITQAVKLFERLREERSIKVTLERNRQEQTFRYEIK